MERSQVMRVGPFLAFAFPAASAQLSRVNNKKPKPGSEPREIEHKCFDVKIDSILGRKIKIHKKFCFGCCEPISPLLGRAHINKTI
jgi:hypothetical protein